MAKIVVTGGAGFIGSNLTRSLLQDGHNVAILDNLVTGKQEFLPDQAHFYNLDLRQYQKVKECLNEAKPDYIIHLAAQANLHESMKNPVAHADENIMATLHLMEVARELKVKKFIFASSAAVYGEADMPIKETDKLEPISPYGCTKLAIEHYLLSFWRNFHFPYMALRFSNVYGPFQTPKGESGVVAIFAEKFLKKETPVIYGNGTQVRDFIFIEDLVKAIQASLKTDYCSVLNISSGQGVAINTLFDVMAGLVNTNNEKVYQANGSGEVQQSILDNEKAKKMLGWQPATNLSEGLQKTLSWYKEYLHL